MNTYLNNFNIVNVFRSSPTKVDNAVYNALSSTVCPDTYPYIYLWRHDMQLVLKRDPNRYIILNF